MQKTNDNSPNANISTDDGHPELYLEGPDKVEPVAIIGFSLKFPQEATSQDGFWRVLSEAQCTMTDVPKERFNIDAFYHPDANRMSNINFRGGHFIKDDLAAFDAPFFSITPAEASSMDPQQRGLLETSYRALENAGVSIENVAGSNTSVHMGCFARDFEMMSLRDYEDQSRYQATGTGSAMLANRLSWFFDLTGPSVVLDTACSSSLNALHLGCESLRRRESTMGLVGGCNLFFNPENILPLTNLNFLSPDSRCYSFDHRANGYGRGEGFGVVVIKLLSDAIKDGDTIRAVVRATGANQDGRTPGITQPSRTAQESLIRRTYEIGGLDLKTTRYFEAHGTGTPLGDPIEASSIASVFRFEHSPKEPLFVGAVKSNIGHLEGASGIAGLLKAVLVLEKGIIPPNAGFECPNPSIKLDEWMIKFPVEGVSWPTSGLRRASVNSFGYGGSNAHVVLDDAYNYLKLRKLAGKHSTTKAPPRLYQSDLDEKRSCSPVGIAEPSIPKEMINTSEPKLLVWSSADEGGIYRFAKAYEAFFSSPSSHEKDERYLDSLAYTLFAKRTSLPWKSFMTTNSIMDLSLNIENRMSKPVRSSTAPRLAFVFTGQGAAWYAMGRELLKFMIFGQCLEESEKYLQKFGCKWSVREELHRDEESSRLGSPSKSHPICTALQVALVKLLRSWGISATMVIGHSSGEIGAAYAAGGLSHESALKVAYYRGIISQKLAANSRIRGAMMSVALSEDEIQPFLATIDRDERGKPYIWVGCINSPQNVTVTGRERSVDALKTVMDEANIFCRKLDVDVAYHSKYMDDVALEYKRLIGSTCASNNSTNPSSLPTMVSSVWARKVSVQDLQTADYWVENLTSRVRFSEALTQVCLQSPIEASRDGTRHVKSSSAVDHLLEIGPHRALQGPARELLSHLKIGDNITYSSVLVRNKSARQTSLEMAGKLHCLGYPVDVNQVNNLNATSPLPQMRVDLPEYPFNHSLKYWHESRLSSNIRFRQQARHELLGTPAADWNPLEARWRNFVKVSESPWIKDHNITGAQIYPAAGMLVMAIEAMLQLADKSKILHGIRLRETTFHRALIVPSTDKGVETEFYLRTRRDENKTSAAWNDFRLCSYLNEEWVENCRGLIAVEYEPVRSGKSSSEGRNISSSDYRATFAARANSCRTVVETEEFYRLLEPINMNFGPTFRLLQGMLCNNNDEAIALVPTSDWRTKTKDTRVQHHVIHPTALDGVFQVALVALTNGGRKATPPTLARRIQEMWISSNVSSRNNDERFNVCAESRFQGFREVKSSIVALDVITSEPRIVVTGFDSTAVAGLSASATNEAIRRGLCFNIDWKPDISLLDNHELSAYCNAAAPVLSCDIDTVNEDRELTCFLFIAQVLAEVNPEQLDRTKPHFKKYYSWMEHQIDRYNSKDLIHGRPEWSDYIRDTKFQELLFDRIRDTDPEGKLLVEIGTCIPKILTGEIDALAVLFNEGLANDFYQYLATNDPNYRKLERYLGLLSHKDSSLRILEIGAGTGGTTAPVLHYLTHHEGLESVARKFVHYTFTDISPGFFEKAKERFKDYTDCMTFSVLNIEDDPLIQGYQEATYDVIIAANVLHATADLKNTLQNTRKLLKSGGKLILMELSNPTILRTGLPFGLLPGWWLGTEANRQWGPAITGKDWHELLVLSGYSGADLCLPNEQDQRNQYSNLIVSTASQVLNGSSLLPPIKIVTSAKSSLQNILAKKLRQRLVSLDFPACSIIPLQDMDSMDIAQIFYVFLPELEKPILRDMKEDEFRGIQKLVDSAHGIIWATLKTNSPDLSLATGLSRCVSSEYRSLKFVTIALEDMKDIPHSLENIIKAIRGTLLLRNDHFEPEYVENDQRLCINRMIKDEPLDRLISMQTTPPKPELQSFAQDPVRPLSMTIASPGLLDTLHFVTDTEFEQPLASDEVEVEVRAVGVNFIDVMIALGQVTGDYLGGECAGVVTRAGQMVGLRKGDRVCCISHGTYRTFARCKSATAVKIPDEISFATAASLPTVFSTAYYALFEIARMQSGESILIHYAAGGVGQAAIQLSKLLQANIYVTVGSEEKKKLIVDLYGIAEDHIFFSRDESFAFAVKKMTNGRGVDVVLNSIAGEGLRVSWDCIATFGRFIEIGKRDIYSHANLPMFPFSRNVVFASIDLKLIFSEKVDLLGKLMRIVVELFVDGKITGPQPLHVYCSSNILDAFYYLQSGKNTGKTVVEMHKDDLIPVLPDTRPAFMFDRNATYLVSGGLGGLGRSIALWMAGCGARNLILLSRFGARSMAAMRCLDELKAQGVNVAAPHCDVTSEHSLKSVLEECRGTMPAIKGCIQGSMVLKDAAFQNLSLQDFNTVLAPKVQGSWNLHKNLPPKMDFFILLSSIAGIIGTRGQANYGCGNTYQDALAYHRIEHGEKAISLDLGQILSVGFVAERDIAASESPVGLLPIQEKELHTILAYFCNPALTLSSPIKTQVVVGIDAAAAIKSTGHEQLFWMHRPLFRHLAQLNTAIGSNEPSRHSDEASMDFKTLFGSTTSPEEVQESVCQALILRLSKTLSIPKEDIDATKPMHKYGIDSLVAVEVRYWFATEMQAEVSIFDILENQSIASLSSLAARRSLYLKIGPEISSK